MLQTGILKEDIKTLVNSKSLEDNLKICMEEPAELIQAISKVWRTDTPESIKTTSPPVYEAMVDEIADVYIIISMLRYIYDISDDEVDSAIWKKMQRNLQRMEENNGKE